MNHVTFTKAEGAQNDFVIVDDRALAIAVEERKRFARTVCHRRKGIGADGVIFIEPHASMDFRMCFYNPDGSDGSMCGNGGRCAALYAFSKNLAGVTMHFEVLGQAYHAEVLSDGGVRLFFPPPQKIQLRISPSTSFGTINAHYVHNGAPHAVILLDENPDLAGDLSSVDVGAAGREIRMHELFRPVGVNANFIAHDASGTVHIRTYEKGVEAETAACGTGNLAAGMIMHLLHNLLPPLRLATFGGDELLVGFKVQTHPESLEHRFSEGLFLEGPARLVFEGRIVME